MARWNEDRGDDDHAEVLRLPPLTLEEALAELRRMLDAYWEQNEGGES